MKADTILRSNKIFTGIADETGDFPLTDGIIAIKDGKIIGVFDEGEIDSDEIIGPETKYIDFSDYPILPGLIESHTHMQAYYPRADLSECTSVAECVNIISKFLQAHKDEKMILGCNWFAANLDGKLPLKNDIDSIIPDKIFLAPDLEMHEVWVNSRLLSDIGITKESIENMPKEKAVMIDTDESGYPTGILRDEMAMTVINRYKVPENEETIQGMFDVWTKYGVTSINDMDFFTSDCDMFKITSLLEKSERLNVRTFSSIDAKLATEESIEYGLSYMNSDFFRLNALKAFTDGTGAAHTAYMIDEYLDGSGHGNLYVNKEEKIKFIKLASKYGLATHFHTCGDLAVRDALDAYECATSYGIKLDYRFSIEHMDTTADEDIDRAKDLGISLNLTPDFLAPTPKWKDNPYLKVFNEKTIHELWRTRSLIEGGANVAFGTDGTASSMNSMVQLYRAVTRCANDDEPVNGFMPEEKISLNTALHCYTLNSARSIGMEDKLGTIEKGKYADIIALNTDIFDAYENGSLDELKKIKNAKVLMTMSNGSIVYE